MVDFNEMGSHQSNDDFGEEKEGKNEFGLLIPPHRIQQLQREMIEQKTSKVKIFCICCAEEVPANYVECPCPSDDCILKNENPKKKGFRTQVCKEYFLKLSWLPGAIGTVQLLKSVKDPKLDQKYNNVKNAIQVHLEKVKEMETLPESFHPDHMDKTYFLNDDGDDEYTFMSTGLKLKIEDSFNKAMNSEKYIQKLKSDVAHLMHIQEEMKKTIRAKKDLVRACQGVQLGQTQEAEARSNSRGSG